MRTCVLEKESSMVETNERKERKKKSEPSRVDYTHIYMKERMREGEKKRYKALISTNNDHDDENSALVDKLYIRYWLMYPIGLSSEAL